MSSRGYSGGEYDRRSAASAELSTMHKMKETYWTTKQVVMKKLGKKQDEHIVASDADLDAKLELFQSIRETSIQLLQVIESYQDRICVLSREENAMGRLLKSESTHDKTRAGKMMVAVGKAQCYSSQQMLGLRSPLVRLYQEVETFRFRAIADTMVTVNRMENARTEYRGALMWMKDVSENLDPDTSKQLQKFRTVQAQVKRTKARFDKLKLDVMQKVDLLAASRCNMFSHVLARYQTSLLEFWAKTSSRLVRVAQSFKGYQYFEFNLLKELGEPSKKLADQTGATDQEPAVEEDDDDEPASKSSSCSAPRLVKKTAAETEQNEDARKAVRQHLGAAEEKNAGSLNNLLDALDREFPSNLPQSSSGPDDDDGGMSSPPFIDFGDEEDDVDLDEIKRKQDEEFDFTRMLQQSKATTGNGRSKQGPVDLLVDDLQFKREDDVNKDDLTLLNEILSTATPSGGLKGPADDFSHQWTAVFDSTAGAHSVGMRETEPSGLEDFLPSCLLDMTAGGQLSSGYAQGGGRMGQGFVAPLQPSGMSGTAPSADAQKLQGPSQSGTATGPKPKKAQKPEMSAWFNLFAELDPLSNPDAIGRDKKDLTDA